MKAAVLLSFLALGCQSTDAKWARETKTFDMLGNVVAWEKVESWFHVPAGINTQEPHAGPSGAGAKGTVEAPRFSNWVYAAGSVLLLALAAFLFWKGIPGAAAAAAGAGLLSGAVPFIAPALGGIVVFGMYAGIALLIVWTAAHVIGHKGGAKKAFKPI